VFIPLLPLIFAIAATNAAGADTPGARDRATFTPMTLGAKCNDSDEGTLLHRFLATPPGPGFPALRTIPAKAVCNTGSQAPEIAAGVHLSGPGTLHVTSGALKLGNNDTLDGGLVIDATGNNDDGLHLDDIVNPVLRNVTVHGSFSNCIRLQSSAPVHAVLDRLTIYDCGSAKVKSSTYEGFGVFIVARGVDADVRLTNSIIRDTWGQGAIGNFSTSGLLVQHNTVFHTWGRAVLGFDENVGGAKYRSRNVRIIDNDVHDIGALASGDIYDPPSNGMLIANDFTGEYAHQPGDWLVQGNRITRVGTNCIEGAGTFIANVCSYSNYMNQRTPSKECFYSQGPAIWRNNTAEHCGAASYQVYYAGGPRGPIVAEGNRGSAPGRNTPGAPNLWIRAGARQQIRDVRAQGNVFSGGGVSVDAEPGGSIDAASVVVTDNTTQ
jgi:hypothetical protein